MPYQLHPEIETTTRLFSELTKDQPRPALHDVESRRRNFAAFHALGGDRSGASDVTVVKYTTETSDGYALPLHWYARQGSTPRAGPAVLYFHGGGMIIGKVSEFHASISAYVSRSGVPFLAVDYRLAPEHPHPTMVEDAYIALTWLQDHAQELNVDAHRIAVYGDSAGGGLAAGLNLLARDRSFTPPIAKQILIYPMVDDRPIVEDKELTPFLIFWDYQDNITGWGALVGKENVGTENVSEYAAPSRAKDLSNLPSTYIEVGGLDLFRDQDIEFARRLAAAQVYTEFHLYPGLPHGFEGVGVGTKVLKGVMENRIRALQSF